jgi:anti-anti-sigma factor
MITARPGRLVAYLFTSVVHVYIEPSAQNPTAHLRLDSARSVLSLSGDLDAAAAPTVRTGLIDASRHASREVIIDLADVPYFDAVTVALFAKANDRLTKTGGRLTLLGLSPYQQKLLRICDLDHLLAVAHRRRVCA